jgi:hypothetical protein
MPIGTTGSQFEELLAPKPWNQCFPILEPRVSSLENCSFPNLGTNASILEPQVPSSPNERFPNLGTNDPQSRNPGFPARGTHGSHMLEPMPPNLGTTGSQLEELLLPKPWNQCFPVLEPWVSSLKNCLFPNLGTNASILVPSSPNERFPNPGTNDPQSWSLGFPILGTSGSKTFEPTLPNLGTSDSQFSEVAVPKPSNQCFPIFAPRVAQILAHAFTFRSANVTKKSTATCQMLTHTKKNCFATALETRASTGGC